MRPPMRNAINKFGQFNHGQTHLLTKIRTNEDLINTLTELNALLVEKIKNHFGYITDKIIFVDLFTKKTASGGYTFAINSFERISYTVDIPNACEFVGFCSDNKNDISIMFEGKKQNSPFAIKTGDVIEFIDNIPYSVLLPSFKNKIVGFIIKYRI